MNSEGAPKLPGPTPEERRKIERANQDADPTKYSALPPREKFEKLGTVQERGEGVYSNVVVKDNQDIWYKLNPESTPARQQAASRLLKGIINVADIVKRGNAFYSKRMPHEHIDENVSEEEARADLELLTLFLDDSDHTTANIPQLNSTSGHNMRMENDSATYHDFDGATFEAGPIRMRRTNLTDHALERLALNLEKLELQYASVEGRELARSIFKEAQDRDPKSFSIDFEEFYHLLLKRIVEAESVVQAQLQTRK